MSLTLRKRADMPSIRSDWFKPGWNPASLFDRDIFDFGSDMFPASLGTTVPSVNVRETPKEYLLEVAAPGLEKKDFNVEINNNVLTISAEKEEEEKKEENGYSRREYSFNSFSRSFTLPQDVKDDEINARYENGVLKLAIPKAKETPVQTAHRIEIS